MRRNLELDWSAYGNYSTSLFSDEAEAIIQTHDPSRPLFLYLSQLASHAGSAPQALQAPPETEAIFSNIENRQRRTYAGFFYIKLSIKCFQADGNSFCFLKVWCMKWTNLLVSWLKPFLTDKCFKTPLSSLAQITVLPLKDWRTMQVLIGHLEGYKAQFIIILEPKFVIGI